MELQWIDSPFDAHDNVLFGFIKKSLVDNNIYGTGEEYFPFTDKGKKYKLRLSDCSEDVKILVNDIEWIAFDGSASVSNQLDFYILPKIGRNEVKIVSASDETQLRVSLRFTCANIYVFLAFMGKWFKVLRNKIQQALQNTYIDSGKVEDLDETSLDTEYKFLRSFALLLGTKRYSGLTTDEYETFLHNVFTLNENGGTLSGYYTLQQALPSYIDRVDVIPMGDYLVQRNELYGKVYVDGTDNTKLLVYPSYVWQNSNEWGMLPHFDEAPDSTTDIVFYVYTDGELYGNDSTNYGALKIKFTNDVEFFKRETILTETFLSTDLRTDGTNENVTGYLGGKYVVLGSPAVDGTMINVDTTGSILVDESAVFIEEPNYNFVDLGTTYGDEIDNVKITYKTYDVPDIWAKVTKDATTGEIKNITMSGHPVYSDSTGRELVAELGGKNYLSYYENNYGSIVLIIRAKQKIDDELKDIINVLIRNTLPLHLRYYLVWSTIGLWSYWGQTDIIWSDMTSGLYTDITFGDLK